MGTVDQQYALITLDDLKGELNIAGTETAWDRRLNRLVGFVTSAIEDYCGRKFITRDDTMTLNGNGTDLLLVDPPIQTITSLTVDGELLDAAEDYLVHADHGGIRLVDGALFTKDINNVVLVVKHGYDRENLPAAIEMAAILWACELFHVLTDNRHGVNSSSHGDESASFSADAIPKRVEALIAPYKIARYVA